MIEYVHFGLERRDLQVTRKLYLAFTPRATALPEAGSLDPVVLLVALKWNPARVEQWRISRYCDGDAFMVDRMAAAVQLSDDPDWTQAAAELLAAMTWHVGEEGDVLLVEDEDSPRWSIDARVGTLSVTSERCVEEWLARYNLDRGSDSYTVLRIAAGIAEDHSPFITIYGR